MEIIYRIYYHTRARIQQSSLPAERIYTESCRMFRQLAGRARVPPPPSEQ